MKKNISFIIFLLFAFAAVGVYSIAVNTLGALTSSANPPQVQVLLLEKASGHEEKYTYARNIDYLMKSGSKSFIYRTLFIRKIPAWKYYWIITGYISVILTGSVLLLYLRNVKY